MAYIPNIPAPVQRTAADGLAMGNTLLVNSTGNLNPIAHADEVSGGLHFVEYLQYLNEHSARGIAIGRRRLGMLAYVWKTALFNDANEHIGEEILDAFYRLKTLSPDGSAATWEKWTGNSTTVSFDRVFSRLNIAARNLMLTDPAIDPPIKQGDIVVVNDASDDLNEPDLTGGATYVYSGTDWVRFLFPSDPLSHHRNQDTQLIHTLAGGEAVPVTAGEIWELLQKTFVEINDEAAEPGEQHSTFSSYKIFELLTQYVKVPNGNGDLFFADDGTFKEVQARIKRIDGGSASSLYL